MKKYIAVVGLLIILGVVAYSVPRRPEVAAPVISRSESDNIRVTTPEPGERIGNPLVVVGEARVFENAFNYRLLDGAGHQIAGGFDTARAQDVGLYGPFTVSIGYEKPAAPHGFVEVYTHSAMDGAEIDLVRIPVLF